MYGRSIFFIVFPSAPTIMGKYTYKKMSNIINCIYSHSCYIAVMKFYWRAVDTADLSFFIEGVVRDEQE